VSEPGGSEQGKQFSSAPLRGLFIDDCRLTIEIEKSTIRNRQSQELPLERRRGPGPNPNAARGVEAALPRARLTIPPQLRRVFRAVVSTVVPEAVNLDEPSWVELERIVEETLSPRPRNLQRQLRLLLRGIQWLPVLGYGRTFTNLDPARRRRFLSTLEDHPVQLIRKGFFGLRTLALLGYYGRPEAARAVGYAADPRGWEALR
jgi:hypothetical protein